MKKEKPDTQLPFFRDKDGRLALWQYPNIPLLGWVLFKAISIFVKNENLKNSFDHLSMAFLFTWAYLELTKGINYFRRLVGLVIIIGLVIRFFL